MGRLQTSIGLITGTDIVGTVDQLVAISAQPRNRLVSRTEDLQKQQTALAELTALVIGVQFAGDKLKPSTQYQARSTTSSNDSAISATASADASLGKIRTRAVQIAATHTAQSKSLTSDSTTALGLTGDIVIRAGGATQSSVALSELNQGLGVQQGSIRITDRSGKSTEIDLSKAVTIDDVLDTINNNSAVQVKATTVGDSIKLTDTSGSAVGNLRVDEVGGGETAADLGLRNINVAASTATGTDIYGAITDTQPTGLQGVPLAKLGGGSGLGTLTSINITTTDGTSQAIDVSSAITTQDVVRLINDSGLNVEAKLNETASGFRIRDLTGGNTNAFSISSSDSTASKLGIAQTSTSRVIEGSDLQRQIITTDTKLSELRQGRGIEAGTIVLRNADDELFGVDVTDADEITVGELIRRINVTDISVTASINSSGDGIELVDRSGGAKKLTISSANGTTTAADLGFNVESTVSTVSGSRVSTINSRQADVIKVSATDSLDDIVKRINDNGKFATATVVTAQDGTKSIAFKSARGGDVGRVSVSSTGFDLGARTTAVGKDAILEVELENGFKQRLTSRDGVFQDVSPGVSITAKAVTDDFESIEVAQDTANVVTNVKTFVTQYNKLVQKLDELTFFSIDSNSVGLLFGSSEALRIETSYTRLLSGSITGAGSIRSIGEIGLSFTDSGNLELDESKLKSKLTSSAEAVSEFFTKESNGLLAKLSTVADRIAGPVNSLLISRSEALGVRVERNNRQADAMQRRLDKERERLLAQFQAAELAISKLQSNQSAISNIKFINSSGES